MIESLVEQIEARHAELQAQMSDPAVIGDRDRLRDAGRAFSQLEPAFQLAKEWRHAQDDLAGARELLDEGVEEDAVEVRGMIDTARARIAELEEAIRLAMVETDPNDAKDVIVEIRAGAGGDEAGLWAGDLYRMLTRYAERLGFKTDTMAASEGAYTFEIDGDGAYSVFKFEGGTHRVQRVPETESQGRTHTSTATVAVLPEAEDVDVQIDPSDLQVDVYRSSGPGGQSVNTTDSAVRITHKPTGIVVSMQDEKSQLQNRDKAMRVLRARLYEAELARQQAEQSATRRSQVGTGERAEKIRTYNFPERRVTDHRVKHTAHNLDEILQGALDEFTGALQSDEKRRGLEAQASDVGLTLARAVDRLTAAGCDTPRLDAEVLLAHALGIDRTVLFTRTGIEPPAAYAALVERRAAREPVAYIVGSKGFRHLDLAVDARVLIPRPETEHLVEAAMGLPAGARVVDVGTGSGAVALALKDERPDLSIRATDADPSALAVAEANAARLDLDVEFLAGDLLAGIEDVDAVVSNPPYVAFGSALAPELAFEPGGALLAGDEGMDVLVRLVPAAVASGASFVALEVGEGQAAAVGALFPSAVSVVCDFAGVERVVVWQC